MTASTASLDLWGRVFTPNYAPSRVFVRGEGMHLYDADGARYLDMLAGLAVNAFGHCHPAIVEAVRDQVGRLSHVSNLYASDVAPRFAERLLAMTGYDRAFLCNSGAEANEAALKMARLYARKVRGEDRPGFVAFDNAFHGRTFGSLSVTGTPSYRQGFEPLVPGVTFAPYGDLPAARAAIGPGTAAVIVEAVQGEGGVIPAPPGFLAGLRAACDDAGALLICDEIQTGMGRTGRFFGWEHDLPADPAAGARPDLCTLAKALGGGLPIGAALATRAVGDVLVPGSHGSTFGGNPVACAAGLAALDLLDEGGLLRRAAAAGEELAAALSAFAGRHPAVRAVRGRGLLQGLVLDRPSKPVTADVLDRGVIVGRAGDDVLRLAPPLIVAPGDVGQAIDAIGAALAR